MKEKIPVWIYLLTIVLLLVIFALYINWKETNYEAEIVKWKSLSAKYEESAKNSRKAADSTEFLATIYEDLAKQIDTVYITNEHEKIRSTISNLDANGGLGLLAKNLQGY